MKSEATNAIEKMQRMPTRPSRAIFRAKALALQLRRTCLDIRGQIHRHPCGEISNFPYVWSQSRTPLWSDETLAERHLQIGKVQNLRQAVRRLNCAVSANEIWSFWKQIGQATKRRGFASGRLLREGCLMPAIGGGLCQLSNALYDVSLQANLQIVERHAHTQIVPGSFAQNGRDATVAWNYVDLRFRSTEDFFIEAVLSRDELIVRLRGQKPLPQKLNVPASDVSSDARGILNVAAHSCASCGQTSCFLHSWRARRTEEKTAWILDAATPEFQKYLTQNVVSGDELLIPLDGERWNLLRYRWSTPEAARIRTATVQALRRSFSARQNDKFGAAYLQSQLESSAAIAGVLARQIPYDATHLIVSQSLLPFLWREGILGGRTFDVLMARLPLHVLHARLDAAFAVHPERSTLGEYRAPSKIVQWEKDALRAASRLVSPHAEVAGLFPVESMVALPWALPKFPLSPDDNIASRSIGFPGPTAARKGVYELREVARKMDLEIVLRGSEIEAVKFWDGVRTRRVNSTEMFLNQVSLMVQPALVEENPRLLLSALARGIPVIATPACGLGERAGVLSIPPGDVEALHKAIQEILHPSQQNNLEETHAEN